MCIGGIIDLLSELDFDFFLNGLWCMESRDRRVRRLVSIVRDLWSWKCCLISYVYLFYVFFVVVLDRSEFYGVNRGYNS